ncbi:MAG: carboxypeptidase-like regulatory domain-containing protein [Bernardetiaceae bacterium]|nr:carboxypeptidase-like regulatory domain-containing protein [Bernardetiaceae bacterium]
MGFLQNLANRIRKDCWHFECLLIVMIMRWIQPMISRYHYLFLSVFFVSSLSAQEDMVDVKGRVSDAQTGEPLAFVNIAINGKFQLSSDLNGEFRLPAVDAESRILFSYIGYEKLELEIPSDEKRQKNWQVKMISTMQDLREIVVGEKENPAHRIIREAIRRKPENDPTKLKAFSYESYNKYSLGADAKLIKSDATGEEFKAPEEDIPHHLAMLESVTERKFLAPDFDNEVVVANRVSGFKHPRFSALATLLQPFGFYEDFVSLLDRNFINPISRGALNRYEYDWQDTLYQGQDTVFIIRFEPQDGKNFEALKGVLYIHSHNYAIQNVVARPVDVSSIDLKIQQQYALVDNQWFPEQLSVEMRLLKADIGENSELTFRGQSYLRKVNISPNFRKRDFEMLNVRIDESAHKKDSLYWALARYDTLNAKEKLTYEVLDSLGRKIPLEGAFNTMTALSVDALPVGFVDFKTSYLFNYSSGYEGFRLGLGVQTNERLSQHFSWLLHGGYGFRDRAFKYGSRLMVHPLRNKENRFFVSYRNELDEPGIDVPVFDDAFYAFRRWLAFRMDRVREWKGGLELRPQRYSLLHLSVNHREFEPLYDYGYLRSDFRIVDSFRNTELTAIWRFRPGERFSEVMGKRLATNAFKVPTYELRIDRAIPNIMGSNFDYWRIIGKIERQFKTKSFGITDISIEGGLIEGTAPYSRRFDAGGIQSGFSRALFLRGYFNTMDFYEFYADRYVHLFFKHSFKQLLFKSKYFAPTFSLIQNVGFGWLDEGLRRDFFVGSQGYEKGYLESGLQIGRIFQFQYGLYELGVGVGGLYRYGAYQRERFRENAAINFLIEIVL